MIPNISGGSGGISSADNGHMSTGDASFGTNTVTHAPVNIGGSTVNNQKWLYVAGGVAALFLISKMWGKK